MEEIYRKQQELTRHPVYQSLKDLKALRRFMEFHVFAVWDFMSLLKALQVRLTCVEIPWKPSPYPAEMVRLINQIVLGEESDLDDEGEAISHFDLYLKAMKEVGADTSSIRGFLATDDFQNIPVGAREFVKNNLAVAREGHIVEVASHFFFGREKLIPEMFETIVRTLEAENVLAPTFQYYLQRHIEVDSNEHGPLALKALSYLTGSDSHLQHIAYESGLLALRRRELLWDAVLENNT